MPGSGSALPAFFFSRHLRVAERADSLQDFPMIASHLLPSSRFEHVPLAVFPDSSTASRAVAAEVAALIRSRQRAGRDTVLGLATGSTPVSFYAELVRLHREEGLSFADVVTFNLDEYYSLAPDHAQSY